MFDFLFTIKRNFILGKSINCVPHLWAVRYIFIYYFVPAVSQSKITIEGNLMRQKSKLASLKLAVVESLSAIGIKSANIKFLNGRIEIPDAGVVVTLVLDKGVRVWKAESSYSVMKLQDAYESQITTQLFTVPMDDDLLLARRLATHISTVKIDAALDLVLSKITGDLQS